MASSTADLRHPNSGMDPLAARYSSGKWILVALVACLLVRGIIYATVMPPWVAPDEPGHVAYALLLKQQGWPLAEDETTVAVEQQVLSSLEDWDFWRRIGRPAPDPLPYSFLHDPDLNRQTVDEPPLYYVLPAFLSHWTITPVELLYIMRALSVLLTTAAVGIVAATVRELFPTKPALQVAATAVAALSPMVAYVGSSANNDAAAMLLCSAILWLIIRNIRWGWTRKRVVALVVLLVMAAVSKKTTLFAVLTVVAVAVSAGWRWMGARERRQRNMVLAGVSIIVVAVGGVTLLWRGTSAEGWTGSPARGTVQRSTSSVEGAYAFWLGGSDRGGRRRLVQSLPYADVLALREKTVRLRAWLRSPDGDQPVRLAVDDGSSVSTSSLEVGSSWQQHEVIHRVDASAEELWVRLAPATGDIGTAPVDLLLDDVSLRRLADPQRELLVNGGAERAARRVESWLARWLGLDVSSGLAWLRFSSYGPDSLLRYGRYVLLTFAGYWGNFGWLTQPVHWVWYAIWAVVSLVGLAGSIKLALMPESTAQIQQWQKRGLAVLAVAGVLAMAQTLLPMIGRSWQPQGRYLFPAMLPIGVLLALGWWTWVPRSLQRYWLSLWLALFLVFDQVCLWGYVLPLRGAV